MKNVLLFHLSRVSIKELPFSFIKARIQMKWQILILVILDQFKIQKQKMLFETLFTCLKIFQNWLWITFHCHNFPEYYQVEVWCANNCQIKSIIFGVSIFTTKCCIELWLQSRSLNWKKSFYLKTTYEIFWHLFQPAIVIIEDI